MGFAVGLVSTRAADQETDHPTVALDAHFPLMAMWAKAGVPEGIPTTLPVITFVKPGDDLQAAIDQAPAEGGVIAFAPGEYVLTQTLRLRSGVFLRGTSSRSTKLHLKLRGTKPADTQTRGAATWTIGVLLDSVQNAGLAHFTLSFDESLPPPLDPRTSHFAYHDNPGGRDDLHVVAVCFSAASESWLADCVILNSGTNPLMIEDSRHISISSVEVKGTHNKGPRSGRVDLAGSEYILLEDLLVSDVNGFVLHAAPDARSCRYNVIVNSRIETDVCLHDTTTTGNLLQNTVISVPAWHNRPAIGQGRIEDGDHPPGPDNLLYLCTVTRSFMSDGRSFSLADNPTRVYRVLEHFSKEANLADAGAAPMIGSLWLAQ